jgi:hypothetical protein
MNCQVRASGGGGLLPQQRVAPAWSLIATAYAFTAAVQIQAVTGVRALSPHGTVSSWVAYITKLATVATELVAALFTPLGATGGLARQPSNAPTVAP